MFCTSWRSVLAHSPATTSNTMDSEMDQFADLELTVEDREQIFDPPADVPINLDDMG